MSALTDAKDGIVETVKTVFWALIIAGLFRSLLFQPFWIPSESMKDTLLIGDFLFINKMAYGYSRHSCEVPFTSISFCPISGRVMVPGLSGEPQRGDVVVFSHPVSHEALIKRLIGLPGDRIQMKQGLLYINDTLAPQEPTAQFSEVYQPQGSMGALPLCANAPVAQGGTCLRDRAIETLPNGTSHPVLNVDDTSYADNTEVFTVPEGNYFFMGDNRDNSADSRFSPDIGGVGFVPAENLVGRAEIALFSSAGTSLFAFWTWRPERFFKLIH